MHAYTAHELLTRLGGSICTKTLRVLQHQNIIVLFCMHVKDAQSKRIHGMNVL